VSDDQPRPSPSQPVPVTQQAPRNGLGIAALIVGLIGVLAGLVPALFWAAGITAVIGLVLGFVGYSRAQRGEATNPTTALGAIITGAIAMILSVVGLLILTGVFGDGRDAPSVETAAETSAPPEPEQTAPTESENIYTGDLEVGDCLAQSPGVETFTVVTVPCSQPHSHEVFAAVNLPDRNAEFPGYPAIDAQAEQLCIAQFEGFVGLPYDQSELKIRFMTPSEQGWRAGERVVHCAVYDPAGEVTGSLRGTAR
jgi:Septum formation